jgi:hypothetical protein
MELIGDEVVLFGIDLGYEEHPNVQSAAMGYPDATNL